MLEKIVYELINIQCCKKFNYTATAWLLSSRSVETNLLCFSKYVTKCMDDQRQVDAVYTDFSKAFDRIDQKILINKLSEVGVGADICRWVASYICGRTSKVSVLSHKSGPINITSGVPQGSHLGPLLFNIFINDVGTCFKFSKFLIYADDIKLFNSVEDCWKMQEDINRLSEYCASNSLNLNLNKCNKITFTKNKNVISFDYTINNVRLQVVNEVRDLGVIMDGKWCFNSHIEKIISYSLKLLGLIKRNCKDFKNSKSLLSLYYAYIYSKLNFASSIWSPSGITYINRLERVQNKFLRFLS